MTVVPPQEVDVDILVAGGGPAGLAAACAIHRATDYSVKVCLRAIDRVLIAEILP
jgi:2-polyprenyl-6-methoxyphenol hydroxylase-like FAD-dependent oxidoreductase